MAASWLPDLRAGSVFVSPTSIVAGAGASRQAGDLVRGRLRAPEGTVLVVADDVVLNSELADPALESLVTAGYRTEIIHGLGSEPNSEVIDRAAGTSRGAGALAVVGIGGGSVLDSAKLLALLLRNPGSVAQWVGAVEPQAGVAPLLLMPTTCGTGSEATRIAMVTVDGAKRASSCASFIPDTVVIDQNLVASLPSGVVASTGMDALAHAAESLMSTARSPMSAHHALRAIELLTGNLELATRGDSDSLASCLWASHLAGQALNAGVVLGHSHAYSLAYECPMPHGTACALVLPYCIAYNAGLDDGLARALALSLTSGSSASLRAAAATVKDLTARIGLPTTLDEAGVAPGTEESLAERCVTEYPRPTNPEPLHVGRLTALARAMRSGDLDTAFAAGRQCSASRSVPK
jgi:alcohol dehydrogenase class IV